MKEKYLIISQKKIDRIVRIKDAFEDDLNDYLSEMIQHYLEDDCVNFADASIQNDIATLIEKHDINVR